MRKIYALLLTFSQIVLFAQCESENINRANWAIHSFDTEETVGEGDNNGRAIHAIDGNVSTFWHTKWKDTQSEFPHHIAIDMGESYPINGIKIKTRNDNKFHKPKGYQLFLSDDGNDWKSAQAIGNFTYEDVNQPGQNSEFSFGAVHARYFKIVFDSNYSEGSHIVISELYATKISGDNCDATGQNNQILTFEEIAKKYASDDDFELIANSNSNTPIQFEVVEGPAEIVGNNMLHLTGVGGLVKVRAYQEATNEYYLAETFQTFQVIDLTTITPVIQTRITETYPLEMSNLNAYKLTATASIEESNVLSIEKIDFFVDGNLIKTENKDNLYFAWWTPASYGNHEIEIKAHASNGNTFTEKRTLNVVQEINDREVITLQNAVIDWGSIGSQWFYGTYEMPQFVGAYDQILGEFNVTCPNVNGGCDDWDRLGYLQIKNPQGQWIELIRYVTPFGVACEHQIDLTDYASVLQGKVEFRMFIQTWGTGGWELELKLNYRKGEPEFLYSEIEQLWQGTYNFGDYANLQPVPTVEVNAPKNTEKASFRVVTTGHGWGQNNTENAAEFYYAVHHFNINGVNTFDQDMKVECNPNPDGCIKQKGTWYYDRAGWCPGSIGKVFKYDITPYIDVDFNFDYEFQKSYVDFCHPNHPDCVSNVTCSNCNDGYNPHYRVAGYNVYHGNNPLGVLKTNDIKNQIENDVTVFPNPSNGFFKVLLEGEMEHINLQIYNVEGASVKKYTFANKSDLNNHTFDVNDLPSGIYFIRIYNVNQSASAKLILNKVK